MLNLNESNRIVISLTPTDIHIGRDWEIRRTTMVKINCKPLQAVCYESEL